MGEWCEISKKIQWKVDNVFRDSGKYSYPLSTIKVNIQKVLDSIEQDDLQYTDNIAELVATRSTKYGIAAKDPNFFSLRNFISVLDARRKGIKIDHNFDTSATKLMDTQQAVLRSEASREFLDNAYGLATEVSTYVENETNKNLFDCMFINRGSVDTDLGIVKSTTDLNRNIRQYQETLFKRITSYLYDIVKSAPNLHISKEIKDLLKNSKLYIEEGGEIKYSGILENEEISSLIFKFLSSVDNFDSDMLIQLYNTARNFQLSQDDRDKARQKLEAYNARVILEHFDEYIAMSLGRIIQIEDFSRKTGKDKYQVARTTTNLSKTYRKTENIFLDDETDKVVQMGISTTPLFRWQDDTTPIEGQYISFQDFSYSVAQVKNLVYNEKCSSIVFNDEFQKITHKAVWDSLSKDTQAKLSGKSLQSVINMVRNNPRKYFNPIFELLSNNEFYKSYHNSVYKGFTRDQLNKLYSINRGIFNGSTSIYELANDPGENDYYAYITQVANTIFGTQPIQYYKDSDGNVQIRTLIDQSVNNIRRSLESTINSRNSKNLISNYDVYAKHRLSLKTNLDYIKEGNPNADLDNQRFEYITFIIPNTNIRVKVVASSGSVYFYNNITGDSITNILELWNDPNVKQFIDNTLYLNIQEDVNLVEELYFLYGKQMGDLCKNLLNFSSRVILNQYVSNKLLTPDLTSQKDIEDKIAYTYGKSGPKYNYSLNELGLVHGNDVPTLRTIAVAKANLYGITTSAQAKDASGNMQSLYTLSRLLGSLQSQFELQEKLEQSITKDFILHTVPGIFEGVFTSKEFSDEMGDSKSSIDMGVSEMAYSGLVYDFVRGLIKDDPLKTVHKIVGNGHVLITPSVNSDKELISKIRINLNKVVNINGVSKAIKDLTSEQLQQLIANELGPFYTKMLNTIDSDFSKLDEYLFRESYKFGIVLPKLSGNFINGFEDFNRVFYENYESLKIYGKTPVDFIKHFTLEYNKSHRLSPLELVDQVHYKSVNGNLGINETILAQIVRFNPSALSAHPELLEKYPSLKEFFNKKKVEILKSLIKCNFRINTSLTDRGNQEELSYIRKYYPQWINSSGDLILAKVNGSPLKITSRRDLLKIGKGGPNKIIDSLEGQIILNPLIEQYNYISYLFSQEFMNSTVGSFVAHPHKSKGTVLEQESAQYNAQCKRNVSFTASMQPFQIQLLDGIPKYYNIAVIEDLYDYQGTITGLVSKIKPFDGATFVNPFVVILENNSLGGAKAGITKKQFVHFKNERTGTGGIIKTAGFGLTNDWIRNSPFLMKMMQKMTDHVWLDINGQPDKIDITKDYRKNKIFYKQCYYKENGKYYKIVGFTRNENTNEDNSYIRTIQEVDENGKPKGEPFKSESIINTNYKLWNFFGGCQSMSLVNGKLQYSNVSVENVVTAMNSIGEEIGNPSKIETQDDLWQPLKQVDVHYVATAGAVKQGAANINSANRYSDGIPYDTQRILIHQAGIQLDKEHHADDADLSLMTQVISACAAKGYTFDAALSIYEALKKATDIGTKSHLEAVRNLFTDGSSKSISQFQEVLFDSIIKSLGSQKQSGSNFAKVIAQDLIKRAKSGEQVKFSDAILPLSDNTIYAKVVSTIAVYLTNTGIKQKIPGILSVLTPSYGIFRLYANRKYESFTDPRSDLLKAQQEATPIYTAFSDIPIFTKTGEITSDINLFQNPTSDLVDTEDTLKPWKDNPSKFNSTRRIYLKGQEDRGYFEVVKDIEDGYYSVHFKPRNNNKNEFSPEEKDILFQAVADIIPNGGKLSTHGEVSTGGIHGLNRFSNLGFVQEGTRTVSRKVDQKNNISNIELDRKYYITRLVSTIEEDVDGNPVEVVVPVQDLKLIRTPQEYKELRKQIDSGDVIEVVEAFIDKEGNPIGRDLAAYNVRFVTDKGNYQLWDLDSASFLFDANELKKSWSGSAEDIQKLQELYQGLFIKPQYITPENASIELDRFIIRARRMLQQDLANLSLSTPDTLEQYQKLLQSRQDDQKWYNRYAQWVNVKLGRGHGSKLFLNNKYIEVNSDNFDEVQEKVNNILERTTQTRIGGVYHTVDKSSIKIQAYEIIMPKIFMTKFGLDEFSDLFEIKSDPDYFIKQYLERQETKVKDNQYAIELKRSNGEHYYLLTKKQLRNSGLTKINPLTATIDNKVCRLDQNENIMYEMSPDTEIYIDEAGHEVIVTDDLEFYINGLYYDSVKLSDRLKLFPNLVTTITEILGKSSNKAAKDYYEYITKLGDYPPTIIQLNNKFHSQLTRDNYQSADQSHPIIRRGREKYSSFLRSLDIIAARIPAQSMQSFMPMRIIAFDNPDINTAYVSTMQILLQGSDY